MAWASILPLFIGIFTACQKNDDPQYVAKEIGGNTYATVTISLNGDRVRAEADDNKVQYWNGNDKINTVDVYLVDDTPGDPSTKGVSSGLYQLIDFDQKAASGQIVLVPRKAIQTTQGNKHVYVLVNASEEIRRKLAVTSKATFEANWNAIQEAYALSANAAQAKAGIEALAKVDPSDEKDVVMMSNSAETTLVVKAGVTESEALKPTSSNRAHVSVQRVAARVVVTAGATEYELKVPYYNGKTGEKVLGKLTHLKYSVAQGERRFYIQQRSSNNLIQTPSYAFVPTETNLGGMVDYDYSGLYNRRDLPLSQELEKDIASSNPTFLLETSHEYGKEGGPTGGFRKGNTPYVLVEAKLTPDPSAIVDKGNIEESGTFYVGAVNGAIYASKENVTNPEKGGRIGQGVYTYTNGKVFYFAYINPDNKDNLWKTYNAPVFRNNVYRVKVTGFKSLGYNCNPFFPSYGPNQGFPNPDGNHDPGVQPPLHPYDPLFSEYTYMSVEVTVLKWNVKEIEVELH